MLFLAPVVVSVALKAARLGRIRAAAMTLAAHLDAWDQDVRSFLAVVYLGVARRAGQQLMRLMIEARMRKPTCGDRGLGNFGQLLRAARIEHMVALL